MNGTGFAIVTYRSALGVVRGVATIPVRFTRTRVIATGRALELCTDERGGVQFGSPDDVWDRTTHQRVPRYARGWKLLRAWETK